MKKSILIAGVSGTGKSEVGRRLKDLGFETHDIDSTPDLCVMVDKVTGLPTEYDNDNDIEKMEKMQWLCKIEKLKELTGGQKDEVAFYCGAPNNVEEMVSSFDKVILLTADSDIIRQRLTSRKDNGFGKSAQVQDYILENKENIEKILQNKGAATIDSNQDITKVVARVIAISKE
jgi:dephospho-CoA kinase